MNNNVSKSEFTIFFEDPFWVGVLQRQEGKTLFVSKITFGAEPTDPQVYCFTLQKWSTLSEFGKTTLDKQTINKKTNPKRVQRMAQKALKEKGISTKAQLALNHLREEQKLEQKKRKKENKLQEQEQRFLLKQEKKKQKHKGH